MKKIPFVMIFSGVSALIFCFLYRCSPFSHFKQVFAFIAVLMRFRMFLDYIVILFGKKSIDGHMQI